MDLELLKEIPGYKAILKSVLKTQIQLLIEQLCEQAGEESIILTASISEGTLSHLGSNMGKGFFQGREEIKSQFLGYCLQSHHNRGSIQPNTVFQQEHASDLDDPGPSLHKRQKFMHEIIQSFEQQNRQNDNVQNFSGIFSSNTGKTLSRKSSVKPFMKDTKHSIPNPVSENNDTKSTPVVNCTDDGTVRVKIETSNDTEDSVRESSFDSENIPQSVTVPSAVFASQTESSDNNIEDTTEHSDMLGMNLPDELIHETVKSENTTEEEELELEITGVEIPKDSTDASGEWVQNASGDIGISGNDLLNQSGSQYGPPARNIFYPCFQCNRKFTTRQHLERHLYIHSGRKDFICEVCSQAFNRPDNLKRHTRIKHRGPETTLLFAGKFESFSSNL